MADKKSEKEVTKNMDKLKVIDDVPHQDEDEDEEGEDLPQSVMHRLMALKTYHNEVEEIDKQYKKERIELEQKYALLRAPIYNKRKDIISGEVDVEIKIDDKVQPPAADDTTKGIPRFWLGTIQNHPVVGPLVTEEDIPALEALVDIKVDHTVDWNGFKLTFVFKENEFFTNTELVKAYEVNPDLLSDKAPSLTNVISPEINWKPKKNLCFAEVTKKQKAKSGKKAGQVRTITVTTPKPSFFHYFNQPKMEPQQEEEEEEEENENENFTLHLSEDYEVAHAFRAEIVPEALLWYTGEACDDDDYLVDEDGEDGDGDEGDDDDGNGDEPAEESEAVDKAPTGTFGSAPPQQPECKQS